MEQAPPTCVRGMLSTPRNSCSSADRMEPKWCAFLGFDLRGHRNRLIGTQQATAQLSSQMQDLLQAALRLPRLAASAACSCMGVGVLTGMTSLPLLCRSSRLIIVVLFIGVDFLIVVILHLLLLLVEVVLNLQKTMPLLAGLVRTRSS